MRYLTPIILLAASVGIYAYNARSSDTVLLYPFIDELVPSTAGDPRAQGAWSAYLTGALGLALLLVRAIRDLRRR